MSPCGKVEQLDVRSLGEVIALAAFFGVAMFTFFKIPGALFAFPLQNSVGVGCPHGHPYSFKPVALLSRLNTHL